jgi:nitroreductase
MYEAQMLDTLDAAPTFGQALPVRPACREAVELLATRRSASALTLVDPGPSLAQVDRLLTLAARVPDHGKLSPWRFIVIEGAAKDGLVAKLEAIAATRPDAPKAIAGLGKLKTPPVCIAVVSRTTEGKIPEWEQVLSAGAVCMNLLLAAAAVGYGANWITGWYAYDPAALALLGVEDGERIAGFVHVGTPAEAPLERMRPDVAAITTRLSVRP